MKQINVGKSGLMGSAITLGCMRIGSLSVDEADRLFMTCVENGINYFDNADIYGTEELFGKVLARHKDLRDKIVVQTKCAIHDGMYDFSKDYLLGAAERCIERLGVEYADALLLHRPDTLMEPEEVAEVFDSLENRGLVRYFGVSNHNPMQMELLKTAVKQPLIANQLEFSIMGSGMVDAGINVNMRNKESVMHDDSMLEYSRIHNITIQAWSPFQGGWFVQEGQAPELQKKLKEVGEKYGISMSAAAIAWILRHPANMQVILGTTNLERIREIAKAGDVTITNKEWYDIYRAAGHPIP